MSSVPAFFRMPREILDQILDTLEEDTPRLGEDGYLRRQPYLASEYDQTQTEPEQQPTYLKTLSLVSRRLRAVVLDRLFLRLQLTARPPPPDGTQEDSPRDGIFNWITELSEIAAFLRQKDLGKTAKSFILKIVDGQGHYRVDSEEEMKRNLNKESTKESIFIVQQWHCFLNEVPLLEQLTIIAPPFCLGIMISVPVDAWISEALHMPYHVLSLGRERGPLVQVQKMRDDAGSKTSLLTAIDWTSVLLNEGSFFRWYTGRPHHHWEDMLLSASQETEQDRFPKAFMAKIISFEYIGIFPPSQSFERVLNTLTFMPALRSFSFQIYTIDPIMYDMVLRAQADYASLQHEYEDILNLLIGRLLDAEEAGDIFCELDLIHCPLHTEDLLGVWERVMAGLVTIPRRRQIDHGSLKSMWKIHKSKGGLRRTWS